MNRQVTGTLWRIGRWLMLVVLFLLPPCLSAEKAPPSPKFQIPFRVGKSGFIFVDANFSGSGPTRTFMLDSGVSGPAILDSGTAIAAGLKSKQRGALRVEGLAPQASSTTDWREVTIRQGRVTLLRGPLPTLDMSAFSKLVDERLAGVLGAGFISEHVVEIDYVEKKLNFFDKKAFHYEGPGHILPLVANTDMFIATASIQMRDCETVPFTVKLDSGSNAAVTVLHTFLNSHPKLGLTGMALPSIGTQGESLNGYLGVIHHLNLAGFDMPAKELLLLREDSIAKKERVTDGSVGIKVLGNFTIFFDRPGNRVILEPRAGRPLETVPPCVVDP